MKNKNNIEKDKFNDKNKFIKAINNNQNKLWIPKNNQTLYNLNTNTWFNLYESKSKRNKFDLPNIKTETFDNNVILKTKQVKLKLNDIQKKIINNWMHSYIKMYNETLKLIKHKYKQNSKSKLSFYSIRKELYDIKHKISEKSQLYFNNKTKNNKICIHELDLAIKLACFNYKSAISNLKNKNIKNFRIRYWKFNKKIKHIDFESNVFESGSIKKNILGKIEGFYDSKPFDFTEIIHDCRLKYNGLIKEYILYVPTEVKTEKIKKRNKVISLDPGIRTFMTGISENKIVKIGDDVSDKIKSYLIKIDKINNRHELPKSIVDKYNKYYNKKINNYVNELHWKTIDYLTKTYDTILIGNMSSKEIISKKQKLNKMRKRINTKLRFYLFHNRLKYKCQVRENKLKVVNETYTSKICSNCGNEHKNLGSSKTYECSKCNIKLCRDINGARNIYTKSLI